MLELDEETKKQLEEVADAAVIDPEFTKKMAAGSIAAINAIPGETDPGTTPA